MANVTSTLQANPGSINEGASIRREMIIGYQDIDAAGTFADDDTATFTIPVKAGEVVTRIGVELITAFNDSGSGDELDLEIGEAGDDPNGYLTAMPLHTDQTEISIVTTDNASYSGAYLNDGTTDNTINGKLYTADNTIDLLFTPALSTAGATYNLNELTAGKVRVVVHAVNAV
jgi:hypothetical protein